ncbi:fatty acyl-AMP ligase [Streptomyces sp. SID6673]|nr:fatty acyl-AMP ligase [Streptomyces sp. SID11726]NEB23744.1 fatty acyl-AMP ligase [Streptomyces sp. SID6673]
MQNHTTPTEATLLDMMRRRADTYEDKLAFGFSYDGDGENSRRLTYRELDTRARAIAAGLQAHGAAGERVLVLCRPGLDHIAGIFGCIYAGAVAVPVHERLAPRLSSVVPDARARFALGVAETHESIKSALVGLGEGRDLRWGLLDEVSADAAEWVAPDVDADSTAMVQYTSGSTTSPKGVVLTHRNLMHNMESIRQSWPGDDTDIACLWLPSHHDMGLIGGVFSMVYLGCSTHLMSPTSFVKRPMRWMEAISRHRATYTVAPNFAYDLCVEHSTAEERAALDLSSLTTAMNGAEPVRAASLQAFAAAFASAGFRPEAFSAVYGLAEATLLVSGGSDSDLPLVGHVDREALSRDRIVDGVAGDRSVAVVGCGRPRAGEVAIVNPVTRRRCEVNEVGEIWLAGPGVAQGYWARPKETGHTFAASTADTSEGPFLRTGDLGFLAAGELFITGRCKDLIVIRGGNHYPNDIELTVQGCHPALVSGRGAAFAFTPGLRQVERLVIVQEVDSDRIDAAELAPVIDEVRATVTERYGIDTHSVVLVERVSIPTTSSGKIQRGTCRQQFLDGELSPVAQWQTPSAADDLVKAGQLEKALAAAEFVKASVAGR